VRRSSAASDGLAKIEWAQRPRRRNGSRIVREWGGFGWWLWRSEFGTGDGRG
jgi:hypothetical protein